MKKLKKKFQGLSKNEQRSKIGIFSGLIGIISNFLLFILKFIAGWLGRSVAIMADATNSLSDSASSLFTILGFHWAAKPADREHPYGHERAEYISGFVVAIIIIVVGFQFLIESIQKIIEPSPITVSPLIISILLLSIIFKVLQAYFYRKMARRIQSETIHAVSKDSFNDSLITSSILVSILLESWTGWLLDGYIGCLLALYIIYSGYDSIRSSISDLLGERPDPNLIKRMAEIIESQDQVIDFHDLDIHRYGPNKSLASVHIEVDARMDLMKAHQVIDQVEETFMEELGIELVGHLDPVILDDQVRNEIHHKIKSVIHAYGEDFTFHDLRIDKDENEQTLIRFDFVIPENQSLSNHEWYDKISKDIHHSLPDVKLNINIDRVYLLHDFKK